jgi:hypothetical protein
MESEFISASRGIQEAMGCYHMVKELGQPIRLPIQLRMDNQAAIATIMNEASSSKTKHVNIKHKYIKELYRLKIVLPSYVTNTNAYKFCPIANNDWNQYSWGPPR